MRTVQIVQVILIRVGGRFDLFVGLLCHGGVCRIDGLLSAVKEATGGYLVGGKSMQVRRLKRSIVEVHVGA